MANNQYVNKVVLNGDTLIDVSDTTAVAADVAVGKYFYTMTGQKVQGTYEANELEIQPFSSCTLDDINLYIRMYKQGMINIDAIRSAWIVGDSTTVTIPSFTYQNATGVDYSNSIVDATQSAMSYKVIIVDSENSLGSAANCVLWFIPTSSNSVPPNFSPNYDSAARPSSTYSSYGSATSVDADGNLSPRYSTYLQSAISLSKISGTGSITPSLEDINKLRYFKTTANKILKINNVSRKWFLKDIHVSSLYDSSYGFLYKITRYYINESGEKTIFPGYGARSPQSGTARARVSDTSYFDGVITTMLYF